MNYFTVKLPDDRTIMHVRAPTKAAARNCALKGLEVVRLSTDDVLSLNKRGLAIVDSETEKVCNADNAAAEDCPPLVYSNHWG